MTREESIMQGAMMSVMHRAAKILAQRQLFTTTMIHDMYRDKSETYKDIINICELFLFVESVEISNHHHDDASVVIKFNWHQTDYSACFYYDFEKQYSGGYTINRVIDDSEDYY